MSKKNINTDAIMNELANASVFFPQQSPPKTLPRNELTDSPSENTAPPEHRKTVLPQNQKTGEGFDINTAPEVKGTFMLTGEEYDAISDLKRPLGRQLGVRVTLHDLARCAVNLLIEDHAKNGEQSFLIRHLKNKKG